MVGVLGVAALVAMGAVWVFRGYEAKLEAEREVLRREIVGLSVARERQAAVVYSAEVRARNARARLEQVRTVEQAALVREANELLVRARNARARLEQERTVEQAALVKEANELLVRARAEWEAIHDEEIRDYEKLSGRDRLLGSDW